MYVEEINFEGWHINIIRFVHFYLSKKSVASYFSSNHLTIYIRGMQGTCSGYS